MINMIELPPQDLTGLVRKISNLITMIILRERTTVHYKNILSKFAKMIQYLAPANK